MNLKTVTITGADDRTHPSALWRLQREFGFVEFGLLLSASREGTPRFPSQAWINEAASGDVVLSGHLCGSWTRDLIGGGDAFIKARPELGDQLRRLQINMAGTVLTGDDALLEGLDGVVEWLDLDEEHEIVLQTSGDLAPLEAARRHGINAYPLFDRSGGGSRRSRGRSEGACPEGSAAPAPGEVRR